MDIGSTMHKRAIYAAKEGLNEELSSILAGHGTDIAEGWKTVLSTAAAWGNSDGVSLLLKSPLCTKFAFNAIMKAAEKGHLDCIKMLENHCDIADEESATLKIAAANGRSDCVEWLIHKTNPNDEYGMALLNAIDGGHDECIALLAPATNLKTVSSVHLQNAAKLFDRKTVELLLPRSNADKALAAMRAQVRAGFDGRDDIAFLESVIQELSLKKRTHLDDGHSARKMNPSI